MDLLDIKEFFKDLFKYLVVVIVVLAAVIYVVTFEQVVGPSMEPTLNNGDVVILNKFIYRFKDIERSEIVSLYYSDSKYLIKRVIGLPGEYVEIKNNKVYIGDKMLNEYYLDDIEMDDFSLSQLGYDVIPEDMYLVLGDNRGNSLDSRNSKVGLISKDDIIGRVRIRIWPISNIGLV